MKLLITGATGLIGRKLTEKLLNEDFDINYLTTVKSKINTIEGAKGFYWNPSQNQIDSTCFSGFLDQWTSINFCNTCRPTQAML